eukprot:TRINITY_DN1459_c0_g1_i8.p1 TRINITY_DN1459_c0_g1~~TRINITY_DN1459_c0_g1_i8.p1  ORF type:complete len:107 (-),score=27.02 TRINITY_DN1459_c0_g1_i8:21-341(-)
MCIRDRYQRRVREFARTAMPKGAPSKKRKNEPSRLTSCSGFLTNANHKAEQASWSEPSWLTACTCLLYTSDAADEEDSVDLGGRRIIKKKKKKEKDSSSNLISRSL